MIPKNNGSAKLKNTKTKEAFFGPISTAMAAHFGLNMGMKGLFGTNFGRHSMGGAQMEAGQMAAGIQHGLTGMEMSPSVRSAAIAALGPEIVENYEAGNLIAKQIKHMPKGKRRRHLKKLRKDMAMTTHLKEAPVLRNTVGAINKVLDPSSNAGKQWYLGSIAEGSATKGQKMLANAVPIAAAVASPLHAAPHIAVNKGREMIAKSETGKQFLKDTVVKGITSNEAPSLGKQLLISPSAYHGQEIAQGLRKEVAENPKLMGKLVGPLLGHVPQDVAETINKLKPTTPAPQPAMTSKLMPKTTGGKALALGGMAIGAGAVAGKLLKKPELKQQPKQKPPAAAVPA